MVWGSCPPESSQDLVVGPASAGSNSLRRFKCRVQEFRLFGSRVLGLEQGEHKESNRNSNPYRNQKGVGTRRISKSHFQVARRACIVMQ